MPFRRLGRAGAPRRLRVTRTDTLAHPIHDRHGITKFWRLRRFFDACPSAYAIGCGAGSGDGKMAGSLRVLQAPAARWASWVQGRDGSIRSSGAVAFLPSSASLAGYRRPSQRTVASTTVMLSLPPECLASSINACVFSVSNPSEEMISNSTCSSTISVSPSLQSRN